MFLHKPNIEVQKKKKKKKNHTDATATNDDRKELGWREGGGRGEDKHRKRYSGTVVTWL